MEKKAIELAPSQAMAEAQFDIQSAITIARRFPRDEIVAEKKLIKSAERPVFADEAIYSYPRGYKQVNGERVRNYVEGPSVVLAREAARIWGNIRYGLEVTYDDDENRGVRAYAYDMETNVKVTMEDSFGKLIQRKIYANGRGTGETKWKVADERELRELTNRRGAICIRNCILQVIPSDIVDNVRNACEVTLRRQAESNRDEATKKIVAAFQSVNVSVKMIENFIGHAIAEATADELTELRKIFISIRDGNSAWSEYAEKKTIQQDSEGALDLTNMSAAPEDKKPDAPKTPASTGSKKPTPPDPPPAAPRSTSKKTPPKDDGVVRNPNYADSEAEPDFDGAGNIFEHGE